MTGDTGVQRFLIQRDNACADATVVASATKSASNTIYPADPVRAGTSTGSVALSGDYTGVADKTIDIQIVGTGGTTARISEPVFAGSGNGTMTDASATSGVASQTFTVTLKDLGTNDAKATLDFYGVTLRARETGAGGNDIRLTVDASGLTYTETDYSVLDTLPADQSRFEGEEHDYGAYDLTAAGELNPNTLRIAFGSDPRIYRQYRAYENGKSVYYFDPPIRRPAPADTIVKSVTGTYSVTVTDGSTTTTYTGIITLYDLLVELLSDPLIEVIGVVTEDKTPGGMAADELPLRTSSFFLGVTGDGSEYVTDDEPDGINVTSASKTETVTITCTGNTVVGAEEWSVYGTASKSIGAAVTGQAFSGSGIEFTIPRKLPTNNVVIDGDVYISSRRIQANNGTNTAYPRLCLLDYRLGAEAETKTFTFTYAARPTNECPCEDVVISGRPLSECLGIEVSNADMALTDTEYLYRQQRLMEWTADKVESNTLLPTAGGASVLDSRDIAMVNSMRNRMHTTLQTLFTDSGAKLDTTITARANSTAHSAGDKILVSGNVFAAKTDGTTAASAPTFDTSDYGSETTDGTVTWVYVSKAPLALWDAYLTANETLLDYLDGTSQNTPWEATTAFTLGTVVRPADDTDGQHFLYRATAAAGGVHYGTTGSSVTWPTTIGGTVVDGDITWTCETAIYGELINGDVEAFSQRFDAQMNEVLAAAGLTPGKARASGGDIASSPCWSDMPDESYYWNVVDDAGEPYLPMFNNVGWHSAKISIDQATGERSVVSTQELWLGLAISCTESLQEGDQFTIRVMNVAGNKTYQIGDVWRLPIISRSAAYLLGGVSGDNTHTWGVSGSVDGVLADYSVVHGAETAYSDSGLSFKLFRGDLPNALGDSWTFRVTREQFRWRQDGGSYSSAIDIPASSTLLTSGISAVFTPGPGLSFEAGDTFSFTIRQPYAPAHILSADSEQWQSGTTGGTLTIDFGSDQAIDVIAIPWHALPSGAGIAWELQDSGGSTLDSGTIPWQRGAIATTLDDTVTARKLVLTLTSATGGLVRWVWAGQPIALSWDASTCKITPVWAMSRGQGRNPTSKHLGRGYSAEIVFESPTLEYSDYNELHELFDSLKSNDDQPLCLLPNIGYPSEAFLLRANGDDLDIADTGTDYAALPTATEPMGNRLITLRRVTASLSLGPVYQ